MQIRLNRGNGTPLNVQLKQQIVAMIENGAWPVGYQLPPERELARLLGVSRNTVIQAYNRLEQEGILTSRQGCGTFVASVSGSQDGQREDPIYHIIEAAMQKAAEMGYTLGEFVELVRKVVQEREEILHKVKVAFVECNREQLDYFSRELELGSGVGIVPVLLDDLRRDPRRVSGVVANADVVVTTFFHQDEVKSLLANTGVDVLGIALDPQLETMVRIARLPDNKRIGLVCLSEAFADRVRKSIAKAGINELDLVHTISRDPKELAEFLGQVYAVIVSPGRKKEVEGLISKGKQIIEFIYEADAGSVNLLKKVIWERLEAVKRQAQARGIRPNGEQRY